MNHTEKMGIKQRHTSSPNSEHFTKKGTFNVGVAVDETVRRKQFISDQVAFQTGILLAFRREHNCRRIGNPGERSPARRRAYKQKLKGEARS